MRKRILSLFLIPVFTLTGFQLKAQPMPIELMFGNDYGVFELSFSKNLAKDSKLGFFHMNSVEFGYDGNYSSIILQDLLYIEALKNFRVAGGLAYTPGGFNPTAGLQYIISASKFFFLCAPRLNIKNDYSYDIMNIIQYKTPLNDHLKLFTRAKFLNVFTPNENIKSYQWFRLGLETKGIQFGLAFNLDERGPDPTLTTNWGAFIRKEIL
ncbi:MAG TPA: hypothetical protein PK335_08675 [Draconibacterium sp.]|nr:hypothetical protein [Draconibacterium sp.]